MTSLTQCSKRPETKFIQLSLVFGNANFIRIEFQSEDGRRTQSTRLPSQDASARSSKVCTYPPQRETAMKYCLSLRPPKAVFLQTAQPAATKRNAAVRVSGLVSQNAFGSCNEFLISTSFRSAFKLGYYGLQLLSFAFNTLYCLRQHLAGVFIYYIRCDKDKHFSVGHDNLVMAEQTSQ